MRQIILDLRQNKLYSTFVYYNPTLNLNKSKVESNKLWQNDGLETSEDYVEWKATNLQKAFDSSIKYNSVSESCIKEEQMQNYESPDQSKSNISKTSSNTIIDTVKHSKDNSLLYCNPDQSNEYINRTPDEEENVKTVKLDSFRLRSQKRGLPIEEDKDNDETPKCSNIQRRIVQNEENCYTGNKYILSDCFTDEKIKELNMRNTVTSTKKIHAQQKLRDYKSPSMSSYISSARKALDEEFDLDDRIEFQLSGEHIYKKESWFDKENISQNKNIANLPVKELSKDRKCILITMAKDFT